MGVEGRAIRDREVVRGTRIADGGVCDGVEIGGGAGVDLVVGPALIQSGRAHLGVRVGIALTAVTGQSNQGEKRADQNQEGNQRPHRRGARGGIHGMTPMLGRALGANNPVDDSTRICSDRS